MAPTQIVQKYDDEQFKTELATEMRKKLIISWIGRLELLLLLFLVFFQFFLFFFFDVASTCSDCLFANFPLNVWAPIEW